MLDFLNIRQRFFLASIIAASAVLGYVVPTEAIRTITTEQIADGAVTTEKLSDSAVTSAKLSDDVFADEQAEINELTARVDALEAAGSGDITYYVRTLVQNYEPATPRGGSFTVLCDTGDQATGGGWQSIVDASSETGVDIFKNAPNGENPPTGWTVRYSAGFIFGDSSVIEYVVCADLTD
jgi:hypothetical protein